MALIDSCILWNKAQSKAVLEGSDPTQIGPDFAVAGVPTYLPGKFDNGVRIDAVTEKVTIANTPAQFDFAKGALECWLKLDGPILNGGTSTWDSTPHVIFSWFSGTEWLIFFFDVGTFYWNHFGGGAGNWTPVIPAMDLPANTLGHFLFVWDNLHATKKRRIFFQGAEVASDNAPWSDRAMTTATIQLGLYRTDVAPLVGILDNPKWYINPTDALIAEIVANMNNEAFPAAAGGRLIGGGLLKTNLIGNSILIH